MVFEAYGAFHPKVFDTVRAMAANVCNVAPGDAKGMATSFSSFWLQRLSTTLWVANARQIRQIVSTNMEYRETGIIPPPEHKRFQGGVRD